MKKQQPWERPIKSSKSPPSYAALRTRGTWLAWSLGLVGHPILSTGWSSFAHSPHLKIGRNGYIYIYIYIYIHICIYIYNTIFKKEINPSGWNPKERLEQTAFIFFGSVPGSVVEIDLMPKLRKRAISCHIRTGGSNVFQWSSSSSSSSSSQGNNMATRKKGTTRNMPSAVAGEVAESPSLSCKNWINFRQHAFDHPSSVEDKDIQHN